MHVTRRTVNNAVRARGDGMIRLTHPSFSVPAVIYVLIGFGAPVGLLAVYSFWPSAGSSVQVNHWTWSNYSLFFSDPVYWLTLLRSLLITAVAAVVSVIVSIPFAFFVAKRVQPQRRSIWVIVTILPFSISYLIRIFAWLTFFGQAGILNSILMTLHIVRAPIGVLDYGVPAMEITFVYLLFPISFLATYVAIERLDPAVMSAALDVGARPWQMFLAVVLPLARTGLFAGFALSFIVMMGDYATPTLVGGTSGTLYINLVTTKFGFSAQWGFGSALAFVLLASMLVLLFLVRKAVGAVNFSGEYSRSFTPHRSVSLRIYSIVLLACLYLPTAIVVLFAFNSSRFVGFPMTGLTGRWFATAISDPQLLSALRTSLVVVAWALPVSLLLGTPAAVHLARARGRWRAFSLGVLAAPVCLPPVMLGLGIIVDLYAIGVTRGFWTIIMAHILVILPTATFIILVRLEGLDPDSQLAAMDLGASPLRVLLRIVLPQAIPGILAAALIGFSLSIDEFIVTYLVTGNSVTLPLFIYSSIRYEITPELNALSSLMLVTSFLLCGIAGFILRASSRLRWRR
jgi:ABC-type spermidine/putrescine transport system permease subunit II